MAVDADLAASRLGPIDVDEVYGDVFEEGKARVLRSVDARLYVGDHVADVLAGRLAGVPVLGVPTGPCPAAELLTAGATAVLPDLRGFAEWLSGWLAAELSVGPDRPGD